MESFPAPSPAPPIPQQGQESDQQKILKLFTAIGELYVSRGELFGEYQAAMKQIEEMANVITKLRAEIDNGKLVKSPHNDKL